MKLKYANDLLNPSSLKDKLKPKKSIVFSNPTDPVTWSVVDDVADFGGKIINIGILVKRFFLVKITILVNYIYEKIYIRKFIITI